MKKPNCYLQKKTFNGEIVNRLLNDIIKENQLYGNILFVRTPTTAPWMDNMLKNNENVTRIIYNTPDVEPIKINNYDIIQHSELTKLNYKKYDIICLDPYHEYAESTSDLNFLSSLLSDQGVMLIHDCCPPKKEYSTSKFKKGWWCGVTYVCLVEHSYNNPELFYGVINNDNGVGIISKQKISYLDNGFDKEKQETLITMLKENNEMTYDYFCKYGRELINLIS